MEHSGEAYETLIERIRELLPDVAEQIAEEVARGRPVSGLSPGSRLSGGETQYELTAARRQDEPLVSIGREDVLPKAYSDDERLTLLIDALVNLAATIGESRTELADAAASYGGARRLLRTTFAIEFVEASGDVRDRLELADLTDGENLPKEVRDFLIGARDELSNRS